MVRLRFVRTTVRLDDGLLREAKKYAAATGRSLTAVISDSLRESLARRSRVAKSRPVRLPTFGGGRILPGINLDKTSEVLGRLDDEKWFSRT
jgi:hypothetical protein